MKYIPRVDEMLVAPPYLLGKPPQHRFESNTFILKADHSALQNLIDAQLNAAVSKGPVHYYVPASVQRVWLAFVRYDFAEAQVSPDRGWLSYSEAMIGFLVVREAGNGRPKELLTYLGVVYIDDSKHADPVVDPYTMPIVLGREAYGLPKSPGQIRYEPLPNYPKQPKLEIWDISPADKRLRLADAIVVRPVTPTVLQPTAAPMAVATPTGAAPSTGCASESDVEVLPSLTETGSPWKQPRVPLHKLPPFQREDARPPFRFPRHPFLILALQLGVKAEELRAMPSSQVEDPDAYDIDIGEVTAAVAYQDLWWRTKLVGLKQFPDPRVAGSVANPQGEACYQVIVESPLEESGAFCGPETILNDQIVEFPTRQRVDLVNAFGIDAPSRMALVGQDQMYYQCGALVYAKASEVNVWTPVP